MKHKIISALYLVGMGLSGFIILWCFGLFDPPPVPTKETAVIYDCREAAGGIVYEYETSGMYIKDKFTGEWHNINFCPPVNAPEIK
jgi:hypothetical protein